MSKQTKSKPEIPIFLSKLLLMLNDHQIQQYISWVPTQNGFKIPNVPQFTEHVLPKYFKHRNYSSFVRQLNMYGFTKLRSQNQASVYLHPNFKKGKIQMIKNIGRKITNNNLDEEKLQVVSYEENSLQKQLQKVKNHQLTLQKKFMQLLKENQKLMEQNQSLVYNIQKQKENKEKVLSLVFQKIMGKEESSVLQLQNGSKSDEQSFIQSEEIENEHTSKKQNLLDDISINEENKKNFLDFNDFASMDNDIILDSNEHENIQ